MFHNRIIIIIFCLAIKLKIHKVTNNALNLKITMITRRTDCPKSLVPLFWKRLLGLTGKRCVNARYKM